MPLLINFKDAVNPAGLDPNATHAVFYIDGQFQNRAGVAARCPHAKLYAITTQGETGHGIFACDSETGDLSIEATEVWVASQVRLGVEPIVVYANQNRWLSLGLLKLLEKYGNRIERWDADFDGDATLPSWASAKQFASSNVDLNVAVANFFGDAPPVAPLVRQASVEVQVSVPEGSTGHANVLLTIDMGTGTWTHHAVPGTPHWSGPGGGEWRTHPLDWDAPPLGK